MKIFTDNFKNNFKVISSAFEKGNMISDSIYLDFTTSYAYVINSKVNLRVPFLFEKKMDENIVNFFVNGEKFLQICNAYTELTLVDKTFSNGKDEFEFSTIIDAVDLSNFDLIKDESKLVEIKTSSIGESLYYLDKDDSSPLYGVFIQKGKVVSSDRAKVYESFDDSKVLDLAIPFPIAKLIINNETVKIEDLGSLIHVKLFIVDLICSKNTKLNMIDMEDENILKIFNHNTFVTVDKNKLLESLNFLRPFVVDVPNSRMTIVLDNECINLNVVDFSKVKKVIQYLECSKELQDDSKKYWINLDVFFNAIHAMKSDIVKLQISKDFTGINITGDKDNKHIVIIQLKD